MTDPRFLARRSELWFPRPMRRSGQAVTEFAIIVPVLMIILLGIADFGRLFASAVAVEAAGREAADYGAFDASYWTSPNVTATVAEMQRRACTAAAGSHLEGYASTDPGNTTCTNPVFACFLERNSAVTDCGTSNGVTDGVNCFDPATEPPCTVHVQMAYDFDTLLPFGPVIGRFHIVRDSRFRISNLQAAP